MTLRAAGESQTSPVEMSRHVHSIFEHLPGPEIAPRFVDPFCGDGSVALYAKERGHEVTGSDVAAHGAAVAEALIENSTLRLCEEDLVAVHGRDDGPGYADLHLVGRLLPLEHAKFIDRALALAHDLAGAKAALVRLLAGRMALFCMRPSSPGTPPSPRALARQLLAKINESVFDNGRENHGLQGDAWDVLPELEGDICFLEPPYSIPSPHGQVLENLLRGEDVTAEVDPFAENHPEVTLPWLLEAAERFPIVALSCTSDAIDGRTARNLMNAHGRKVESHAQFGQGASPRSSQPETEQILVIGTSTRYSL